MALAIANDVVRVTNNAATALTTATFNTVDNTLLIAGMSADHAAGSVPTITYSNNGAALTWTTIQTRTENDSGGANGVVSVAWALIPTARTGLTVTTTTSINNQCSSKVYGITGHDLVSPIGANGEGSSTINTLVSTAIVTTRAGSLFFMFCNESTGSGANPTSSDLTVSAYNQGGEISGGSGYKTVASSGTSTTGTIDATGATAYPWNYVTLEIKAALVPTTTRLFTQF